MSRVLTFPEVTASGKLGAVHFHRTDKIREAMDLARDGVLVPRVALQLPMEQAAEAHRLLERGGLRGRIVLTFDEPPSA
jgi:NADPH:quinone reductase-like Zn-dependent oxidoreductase